MLGGRGDVVVVFAREAQFSAVTLVHNVPQFFRGQRLWKHTEHNMKGAAGLMYVTRNSLQTACRELCSCAACSSLQFTHLPNVRRVNISVLTAERHPMVVLHFLCVTLS